MRWKKTLWNCHRYQPSSLPLKAGWRPARQHHPALLLSFKLAFKWTLLPAWAPPATKVKFILQPLEDPLYHEEKEVKKMCTHKRIW
jgi:hypothetical protein